MSISVTFWPLLSNSLSGIMKARQTESLWSVVLSLAFTSQVQGCEAALEAVLKSEALTGGGNAYIG